MQWIIKWFFCHCRSTPRYMAQVECRNSSPKTSTAFMKMCSWYLDLPMILLLVSRITVTFSMVGTSTTLILIVSGWPSNTIRHDSVKTLYSSPKSQQSLSKHGNNLSIIVYFLLSYMNVWIECYLQSRKKHWYKKHVVSLWLSPLQINYFISEYLVCSWSKLSPSLQKIVWNVIFAKKWHFIYIIYTVGSKCENPPPPSDYLC